MPKQGEAAIRNEDRGKHQLEAVCSTGTGPAPSVPLKLKSPGSPAVSQWQDITAWHLAPTPGHDVVLVAPHILNVRESCPSDFFTHDGKGSRERRG